MITEDDLRDAFYALGTLCRQDDDEAGYLPSQVKRLTGSSGSPD
jgi:hypothetical protein